MLHNLMDFNPLDILAAAALGEKDAPSNVKTSKESQSSSAGQTENSETAESKDADEDSNNEMGKTTSNNLKHNNSAKDIERMAPQKMPWSPETLLPDHLEGIATKQQKFSLDDLVQDIKKKGFNVELQKIIDKNVGTDLFPKTQFNDDNIGSPEVKLSLNNNMVSHNNVMNNLCEMESASKTSDINSDNENAKEDTTRGHDCVWRDETVSNPSEDTMDSSDSKLQDQTESVSDLCSIESIILDHSYALTPGKIQPPAVFEDDDDIDVCSDNSPLSEDSEQRHITCHWIVITSSMG
uniref:Uncharacterized protein n=1 Tax=Arion vulgaris TaxID=1028688 RepID=A0A0B7AI29_9EUPU